ncbi:hypothetical protein Tco_0181061 [Tanacetum coccineum]
MTELQFILFNDDNLRVMGLIQERCTAKKRVKDSKWYKERMLLAQAQEAKINTTSIFKADHVDAFDSDCNEAPTASAIFMARFSATETEYSKPLVSNNDSYDELTSNINVISYAEYMVTIENDAAQSVPPIEQNNDYAMILSIIEQMQSQVERCNTINDLKAQLQEKSIVVNELKQLLTKLKGKSQVTPCETTNLDFRFQKLDDENVSLAFKVSSFVKEREHLNYKQSSKPHLNQNDTSANTKFAKPPTLGHKLYSVTLVPKTQFIPKVVEKNDFLRTITSHLDTNKELLVYVSASCPFTQNGNEKCALATSHRNNNKPYVDTSRTKQIVINDIQKQAVKQNTQKTNSTLLPSIGRVSYTYASGSQPKSNTRNDRIQ